MSDQAARIAGLSPEKQALLLRRLRERSDSARRQIKPRAPGAVSFPLSFAQQRLWFLNQLQPDSPFYNVPDTYRLDGPIDADVLERSFDALVRRHETLRTTFVTVGGEPRQIVNEPRPFVLQVTDLTGLPAAAREAEALRLAEEEAARLFDLSRDTLLRARLLRLGHDAHLLSMSTHHITSDGWSRGVLTGELMALYEAFSAGREPSLPELPVQYADYAVWQREYLTGEVLAEQLSYWREQLGGELPVLELPADRPRPPLPSYRGAYYQLEFPEKLGASLRALGRESGTTLFMVLLAAFDVLLHRYTGQTDLVVGTPTAGRNRREVEHLIGFFVNTLVMRTNLGGNPTFRELLGRVREVALGAQSNQELPFEKLVEELHPQRDMSRNPLFQVAFGLQNAPEQDFALSGLTMTPLDVGGGTSRFDLELHLWESDEALGGMLIYSTDLFEEASVARLHTHYVRLLEGVVSAPDAPISDLPLLTEGERRQLLVDWNQTAAPYPRHQCLQHLFDAQAARTPSAPAVVCGEQTLTYAELEARSNQLAHHLVALGVKAEARVGVCLGRSTEMVVALLGVLKAGAAYVPLDPEYPTERLSFLLKDAGVSVVVTQQQTADAFAVQTVTQLRIDAHWPEIALLPETDPGARVTAENLAYVIYTSGSTGRPKGVEVTHRAVARLLFPGAYARLAEGQSFLQLSTPSFDASTLELWAPLLHGGRCVLVEERLPSPARLAELIARHAVSSAWLTSSLFNAVIDEQGEALGGLRQLLIGGEALSAGHVRRALELLPGVRLVNGYGPTEGTTFTCCHEIGDGDGWGAAGVPIGRPIENTRVYVVDGRGEVVPVGVSGELLIGGEGLARGYLNRPGLTAERFVPDPFSGESGARLYRSGDVARWRADGALEYLGRADEQVKLRGFRIEPGEIEAALRRHAGIADAAVIVREDEPGDRRLVAYVANNREGAADEAELREYLKGRLPEYMVPSHVVALDALPLTSNGKTDRRALQALAPPEAVRRESFVAPRDALEQQLADIWAEVLRARRLGINDNFFDLGGHSLLATRVVNLLRERCGVELPLRVMFESPTVEGMALHIRAVGRGPEEVGRLSSTVNRLEQLSEEEARAVSMPRRGDDGPPPLSFAQQRLWFLQQLEPESPAYNLPSALRLTDALDTDALERSLGEIVRRHEALRTTFDIVGGQPRQFIADARPVRLSVVDLSGLPVAEREAASQRLVEEEIRRPFDLARGPLFRARLLRLGPRDHTLLLVMHHIVSDGWSMGVLVRELSTLYAAFEQSAHPELAELPVQYADYAVWQREYLTGEVLAEQLSYWREQLGGELPVLELPADRPRPPVRSYRGAEELLEVDARLAEGLRALGRGEGATLFMVLLAAFDVLLHRYTGRTDVVVGTPVAGRTRAEVEHLIGFFVNTLALRTELDGAVSFRELLRRVRETTVSAFAHQELPFERVVEELRPERNTSHAPLFQIMFALQNASDDELELSGVGVEELDTETGTAKLDLRLSARETPDGLSLSIRYSTDLFDAPRIRLMLAHYRVLLEGVLTSLDTRISDLPLLTEGERRQILVEWNDTARAYPSEQCLHQLFEAQAARTPAAVAVIFEREELTYAELNARANRLARRLRALGVGADTRVGVMLERSPELVVALLGVLKAGGAYVPLDPSYPRERLSFMLEDAACPVLLTQQRLVDGLPKGRGQVVGVDDPAAFEGFGDEDLAPLTTPDHLAYVIYTSGSTGRPKGAMNTHRAIVNRLRWMQDEYRLTPDDRVMQKTPFSFDVSVWEFFWPLLAGAALVVARPGGHRDSTYLADLVLERQVTTLHFVPSMLQVFLEEPRVPLCKSLRRVISSGEALPYALQQRFFARSGAELHNLYGPTEAAVDVTAWHCRRDAEGPAVPIGRPIANIRTYILDKRLNPVPAGVAGELHLGGVGLARGYLNRPGLTAEKFIPDPFSTEPGARLYKTGDLARHLPAGELEYLGRRDQQVKIRGFRVEPGEIEAVLGAHASVRECVVTLREEGGDRRLVAYVVGSRPEAGELRAHLRARLPEYMVPADFVMLDALPLSPNGKVERGALPAPDATRADTQRAYVAPRTPTERALAGMWAEILRVERVGVTDNFFELGGDSIKGAVFINRLQDRLGEIVHVITIFNGPTVGQLAAYLDEQYGGAVRRLTTDELTADAVAADASAATPRTLRVGLMRELLGRPARRGVQDAAGKNPRAVFVLSPPRSGSTLLRVMLAGHPLLFAPPELELLSFDTLQERRAAFSGARSFWLEGLVRAVMELKGCDATEAKRVMEELEARGLTTKECYRLLQEWLGERRLVDKTPSYAFDPSALAQAEEEFDAPLYVHLIRHPFGMIRSFEEARMEQIFFRHEHPFQRRELAELTWLVSHQNITRFLERVPRERQHRVYFEELLDTPDAVLRGLCRFLRVEFAAEMCSPYQDQRRRMTDGVHAESRMLGDVKFHQHTGVDARVGARWREQRGRDDLAPETWEMAAALGYEVEQNKIAPAASMETTVTSPSSTLVMLQPHGRRPPFFCVHPAGANTLCYAELARQLGEEQPFYGLQAPGLDGRDEPLAKFEELAALYVEAVRSIQPRGPYLLGGWSMGGPVAFEMAQQFHRQGQPVALLAVLDSHAPDTAADAIPTDDETLLRMFAGNLGRRHGVELDELRGHTFDEKLLRLGQLVVGTGALPNGSEAQHIQRLFRVFKANIRALVEYEPRKYPGRITLFRARQRFDDSPADPSDGWDALASEGVELHVTPGTHYSMIDMAHAHALAVRLRACLEGALAPDAAEEGAARTA